MKSNVKLRTLNYNKPKGTSFYRMKMNFNDSTYIKVAVGCTPTAVWDCSLCGGIIPTKLSATIFDLIGKKTSLNFLDSPSHTLISSLVDEMLEENKILGYRTIKPIIRKYNANIKDYVDSLYELEVLGRCRKIFSSSGEEIKGCPVCGYLSDEEREKSKDGIMINEDYWDGSDIFLFSYGVKYVIVTERLKNLFEEHNISDVEFTPIEEVKLFF